MQEHLKKPAVSRLTRDMMAGGEQHIFTCETHIHDLPDECLVNIMRQLDTASLPIAKRRCMASTGVTHPLQCTLVCKRWRALADEAVRSVHPSYLSGSLVHLLNRRFKHITALSVPYRHSKTARARGMLAQTAHTSAPTLPKVRPNVAACALVQLSRLTPHLEHLCFLPSILSTRLYAVAQALTAWPNLKSLDLGNYLELQTVKQQAAILDALRALPSLRHLGFTHFGDNVSEICRKVGAIESITTLELVCSLLPFVPDGHFCAALRKLTLLYCREAHLSGSLDLFTELQALCVKDTNTLVSLPESLGLLPQLTTLKLRRCHQLASLPSTLGQLDALEVLKVSYCWSMQEWRDSLRSLRKLQTLVLNGCREAPQSIGGLTLLEHLRIGYFDCLPGGIGNLCRLRKLELFTLCMIAELPFPLGRLSSLQVLDLQDCRFLRALPLSLGELTAVKVLRIFKCSYLEALPDSLSRLTNLEICEISYCPRLLRLPEGVCELQMLRKLKLSHCISLKELPKRLGQLSSLKELHVEECPSLPFPIRPEAEGGIDGLEVSVADLKLSSVEPR